MDGVVTLSIYIMGDIHGSQVELQKKLDNSGINLKMDDTVIVTGDAGLTYGHFTMGSLKKMMHKIDCTWIIMRGNHDTLYWRDYEDNDRWHTEDDYLIQNKYPKIKYVRDEGGIYNIGGYNFLFVPGAYSVDKWYRLNNDLPYEPEEELTVSQLENLLTLSEKYKDDIDFVIAHTFPKKLEPQIQYLFMSGIDQNQVSKQTELWLDDIMHEIHQGKNFKHYFGGHFHDDKQLAKRYTIVYKNILNVEDYER